MAADEPQETRPVEPEAAPTVEESTEPAQPAVAAEPNVAEPDAAEPNEAQSPDDGTTTEHGSWIWLLGAIVIAAVIVLIVAIRKK